MNTSNKILVIAPHPDDETLGCGGTLLRNQNEGAEIHWLIVTGVHEENGWPSEMIFERTREIEQVAKAFRFAKVHNLTLPTARLDTIPIGKLVEKIGAIVTTVEPNIVFLHFGYDIHTDHQIIAKAVQSSIKWFRYQSINKVLMYETLSETHLNYIEERTFRPNVFSNITEYIDQKVEIFKIYASEIGEHPFPRSEKTIRALSTFRGSQSGYEAAEAFELVFDRQ